MARAEVTAILSARVRGLLDVKNRRHNDLEGIDPNILAKWLGGFKKMDLGDLKRLAEALDCTSDYLIGLGNDYRGGAEHDNYALAAAKMSFSYFLDNHPRPNPEQERRCRRIWEDDRLLVLDGAPRTAKAWKSLAELMDCAVPHPPRIGDARRV